MIKKLENSKGQIVLGVLLVLAVVTTLGLSLSRKTEIETKIDTDEALLKQAFNMAESGVDYYLSSGSVGSSITYNESGGGGKADVSVIDLGSTSTLDSGGFIPENESTMFWLVGHNDDGSINEGVHFGVGASFSVCIDADKTGSVKVDYLYKEGGDYKVDRYGYNFNFGGGGGVDGFDYIERNCSGNISTGSGDPPLLVVVTLISGGSRITLNGTANFPKQGIEISSVGRVGDLTSGVNTKVKVQNRYRVPAFMLEAITAGGGVE